MAFERNIPYNQLPDLPPEAEIETSSVLKMAIRANKALAELRMSGQLIPNQAVLIQTLGLSEAKLSSEIENIVTTNDDLYWAFADGNVNIDAQTKEVLFYKDALWYGYDAVISKKRLLTTPLFIELVQILKNSSQNIRKLPGTKLSNPLGEIIYTPPEGEEIIRKKLASLEKFIYEESTLDPLVQLALIHYQFEAIHPFYDGNGRTGRIINILFLIYKNLLEIPVLYLSRYIIENKTSYYAGLRNVTENNAWETWVLYVLKGLEQTAIATREKVTAIHRLSKDITTTIRAKLPSIYSKELVDVLFRSPYCKIKFLEDAGIAKRQTASLYLQQLEKAGIVHSIKKGRDIYYINDAFLKILIS
ncbi:MAG: Fic family protein [Verrucomicrobia bacterium]|nr:Fic family protein [Verrucomicrobiota bacterium]